MTVTGTYITPSVSLTFNISTLEPINFTGTHNVATDRTITGNLNGSGYNGDAASCTR